MRVLNSDPDVVAQVERLEVRTVDAVARRHLSTTRALPIRISRGSWSTVAPSARKWYGASTWVPEWTPSVTLATL